MLPLTRPWRVVVVGLTMLLAVAGCAGGQGPAWRPNIAPAGGGDSTAGATPTRGVTPAAGATPATDLLLGPAAADEPVSITVSLRLQDQAALATYLAGLSDPSSANYRQYLSAAEFGARFGLPLAEIDRVVAWLSDGGLAVTRLPQRTSLLASGTAGQVERLLGIALLDRQTAAGRRYHVPVGTPQVPAGLAGDVAGIVGLDSTPALRSGFSGVSARDVPNGAMAPVDVARAYGIDQLWNVGLHGEGVSVGLVALDAFTQSDIERFDRRNGVSGPPIDVVRMPDALDVPGDEAGEVALDIQVLRGIAPNAQIVAYEASTDFGSMAPVIGRIVADGRVQIVSISFGLCEKYYPADARAADEQELAAAYAAGISIFVASGDDGAYDCRNLQLRSGPQDRDLTASTDWPSSSAHAIAVGGTYLTVRQDGTYLDEAAWADPLSGGSTGGGLSTIVPRPDWQAGAGVDNADSNGMRQLPDVAGPADPSSGFDIQYTEQGGDFVDAIVGGTSAATPFFAATMVLTQQLAEREGVAFDQPLGPVLYQVAAEQGVDAFHDIVRGSNLLQAAGPGWDYATGLGSPRAPQLARAIVDFLAR
jgi:kumamolisin